MTFFTKNRAVGCFLLLLFLFCGFAEAKSSASHEKPTLTIIDGFYPAYPKTKPATPGMEKAVERGEYLAKIGDCIACHSNVKGNTPAYAGGLPINTPFGTFYSPNITPDIETGIGAWSEQDFIRALKEGRGPHGENYFPVYPFVYFANITDQDAKDLYAYFMSIPAVSQKNKSLPFPFSVPGARLTLWGWDLLFFFPNTRFSPDPKQSDVWNRGKYLVDGLGHCSMCHTPLNALGSPKQRYYLSGGFIDGYWAPNINKAGLANVTPEDIGMVFSQNLLLNDAGPVAGPMAEVNHDSLKYLTHDDQIAIGTYLKTVESDDLLGLPPSDAKPTLSRGKQIYLHACIICHQNGEMSAPLIGDGNNWYRRLKDSGLTGLYDHVIKGYNSMPIKGACVTCSDNDMVASVNYILDKSLSRSQRYDVANGGAKKFPVSGKALYNQHCSRCHDKGLQGAPMIGDKAVWKPLIKQNMDVLIENTVKGTKHPRQGVCAGCTTGEYIDAIKYMVNQSKTEGDYSLW